MVQFSYFRLVAKLVGALCEAPPARKNCLAVIEMQGPAGEVLWQEKNVMAQQESWIRKEHVKHLRLTVPQTGMVQSV
jgi:hypothetical protein